ncbi:hypothetical protein [Escherichia coli]|nr:hypothetical protein [Escherichia coli]
MSHQLTFADSEFSSKRLFDCFSFKLFGITLTAHGHLSLSHLK